MFNTISFAVGIIVTCLTYVFLRNTLNVDLALRTNYRNRKITCLGGFYFLIPFLIIAMLLSIDHNLDAEHVGISYAVIIIVIGFALLGLVDDLIGNKDSQGFKGHILSLLKGNITTGSLKLFGGPIICFIALSPSIDGLGYVAIIQYIVAISLIANLVNLFDLAPGRSLKVSGLAIMICVGITSTYEWQFAVIGILLILLILDLKELMMLGDIGSNMIGALVGFSIVNLCTVNQTYIVLCVALALNLLSEFVSFSKIINGFTPLRYLDTLGQTKERKAWLKEKLNK